MKALILQSLCYFDIFKHPLKKEELARLCNAKEQQTNLDNTLAELLLYEHCFQFEDYYSINSSIQKLVMERKQKEKIAEAYIKKLPFYTKIIRSFPFVRSISISGSLSKGVMHKDGDIDYFIITKKNRLWICRSLLILFKKVFLLNSRKYFCLNYFVDEDNTEILDQNIFTAIEVSHLIPVYNANIVQRMKDNNSWINNYFPNHTVQFFFPPLNGNGILKRLLETLFIGQVAERLDLLLMKTTYKRWTKKFKNFNPEKLELTMRSNRGISKHHPSDYQTKVLAAYQERIDKLNIANEGTVYA